MKHTKSAGGVVINTKTNKILVVNQKGTSWSLPKGHIDPGEDALMAAKREIWEESGVKDIYLVKELGEYQRHKIGLDVTKDDTSELKTISMFLFNTEETALNPIDEHNPEARWVDKEDVPHLLTHPKDKEFFEKVVGDIF